MRRTVRKVRATALAVAVGLVASTDVAAQGPTVAVTRDALRVQAPALAFIEGDTLAHLRDGRSVRVAIRLRAWSGPGAAIVSEVQQVFNLSFDLWEERIAVTRIGAPPRAASHMKIRDAEAWCYDSLTLPLTALLARGRDTPFWVSVEYAIQDQDPVTPPDEDSLTTLINALSRRKQTTHQRKAVEAGPFRLSELMR